QTAGADPQRPSVIGGGSRSAFWTKLLASALGKTLALHRGGEKGPAFGAARLARLAVTGERASDVCAAPPVASVVAPRRRLTDAYADRLPRFRALYSALKPEFQRGPA